jgi:hypothetical protein
MGRLRVEAAVVGQVVYEGDGSLTNEHFKAVGKWSGLMRATELLNDLMAEQQSKIKEQSDETIKLEQ